MTTARLTAVILALVAGCAAPRPAPVPAIVGAGAAPSGAPPGAPPGAASGDVNVPTPALLDLRAPDLRARFGEPGQARRDGGAEIWNYEMPGLCRLNLVLQRERGTQKVVHAQARMATGGTEDTCLRALERRR